MLNYIFGVLVGIVIASILINLALAVYFHRAYGVPLGTAIRVNFRVIFKRNL